MPMIAVGIFNKIPCFVYYDFPDILYERDFVKPSIGNIIEPRISAQDLVIGGSASDVTAIRLFGIWEAAQLSIGIDRITRINQLNSNYRSMQRSLQQLVSSYSRQLPVQTSGGQSTGSEPFIIMVKITCRTSNEFTKSSLESIPRDNGQGYK